MENKSILFYSILFCDVSAFGFLFMVNSNLVQVVVSAAVGRFGGRGSFRSWVVSAVYGQIVLLPTRT